MRVAPEVPPRAERISRAIGYFAFFCGGLWGIIGPLPKSIELAVDPIQLWVWSTFMLTAAFACYGAARGRYLIEYSVLPFMVGGAAIYWVAIVAVVVQDNNPASGLAGCLILCLMALMGARWFSLSVLLKNPLKVWLKYNRKRKQ